MRQRKRNIALGQKGPGPMPIFKQTILNTAYIKTLEIFPTARESLFIETSASRSVKKINLSSLFMIVLVSAKVT